MKSQRIPPYFAVFTLVLHQAKAEVFTAFVELEKLLSTEGEIIRTLETCLKYEEGRLKKLRQLREEFQEQYLAISQDAQSYLSNPVNAFLLVKRLTTDWQSTKDLINDSQSKALLEDISRRNLTFPDEEDLSGSAVGLIRLQNTYLLDTSALARGQIGNAKFSSELSGRDCQELGRLAYKEGDYKNMLLWTQEAHVRFQTEDTETANRIKALEYLAYSNYMLGNVNLAYTFTNDILQIDPNHTQSLENAEFYREEYDKLKKENEDGEIKHGDREDGPELPDEPYAGFRTYEKLCRGESSKSAAEESKLHCSYVTNNSPYLLLQPVKEEELNLEPRILVYHDVITEKEIEAIKNLAIPNLARAAVYAPQENEFVSYRISKLTWLKDSDHYLVNRVSQRIGEVTGLNMSVAEEMQVVNYGIGGHYEPHYDFAEDSDVGMFEGMNTGNRIATWLNYISDVEAGGATVFPYAGVQVKPEKGSAALWYNLLENGKQDFRTYHAACPVLVGSKWVANKWIHEYTQEFRRRCNLDPNK